MADGKVYSSILKIWKDISGGRTDLGSLMDYDVKEKINSIFHIGKFYHYIFDTGLGNFLYMDKSVEDVLGYDAETFTTRKLFEKIHPEDQYDFANYENTVLKFFSQLRVDQIFKYKVSYDFRIQRADGEYIRILHQVLTINHSDEGEVLQTLGVHTDITHIKDSGPSKLSFIGLEGEPSYIDVNPETIFRLEKQIFTSQEQKILKLLAEGRSSAYIAEQLCISVHTLRTHRKNIMRKAEVSSTPALIAKTIKNNWI